MTEMIMNIGIFAHVDAGKTTVTENLLYEAGATRKIGRVDTGNTVTDTMDLERKRGISIQSTPVSFTYKNVKINLIDTPGHVEFVAEVERAMSVLDGAVLVVSAKEGVQSHTILLYESLKKLGKPIIIFINKMDRMGVDVERVIDHVKQDLCKNIIPLQSVTQNEDGLIIGDLLETPSLIDDLSLYDDALLEGYINEETIDKDQLHSSLQNLSWSQSVYPVCFGSALKNVGINDLLEAIVSYLPVSCPKKQGPLEGVVFKIVRNKQGKREIYTRLYSGSIRSRQVLGEEKISFIKRMENGKLEYVKEAYGNDIVVLMGPEKLRVGDVIGQPSSYKRISLGTPTLRTRISAEDKRTLAQIIDTLAESDPFLEYDIEPHSKDLYLNLFGEIQMEIIESQIKEGYGVDVTFSEPSIIYKEMPVGKGHHILDMYVDDHPFCATVGLRVEPNDDGVLIKSDVSTGHLPQTFQNGIIDGIERTLREGLKGWEITNVKVTITEGAFNSVDSTPSDYRNLSPIVFMEALSTAQTKLLWPVNKFTIKVDQDHYGKIMSDMLSMKAFDIQSEEEDGKFIIRGKVPIETSHSYEKKFVAATSGMGMLSQVFYKYMETPQGVYKERPKNYVDPLNRGKYILSKLNAY